MAIKEQNITLNKGLQMDVNPLFQGDGCLSDCLNGVLISKVGQNFCLQQDSGNGRVGTAYLPEGFIPCCTASMGNIVYLVLFNPLTKDVEVGSFPSPKTIYDTVSNNESYSISKSDFQELDNSGNPTGRIFNTKQYINLNTPSMSTGDKFLVYEGSKNQNDKSNISANAGSISDVGDEERTVGRLLRPLSYQYFVEDKEGQRHDIDYIDLWYENNYTIPTIELDASTGVPDIDSYRATVMQAFNSFTSKYRGSLGICWYLNIVETYTYLSSLNKSKDKFVVKLSVTWDDESEKKSPAGFYILSKSITNGDNIIESLENYNTSETLPYNNIININNYYDQIDNSGITVSDFISKYEYTDMNSQKRNITINDDIKYYNNKFYINATHIKNNELGFIRNGIFEKAPILDIEPSKLCGSNNTIFSEFKIRYLHQSVPISNVEVENKHQNRNLSLSIAPCIGDYGVIIPLSKSLSIPLVINDTASIIVNTWQYSVTACTLYLNMDMNFPYPDEELHTDKLILKFYLPFKDSDSKYSPIYTKTIRLSGATYISSQIAIPVVTLNANDEIKNGALIYGFLYGVSIQVTYSKYNDLIEVDSNNEEINLKTYKTAKFLWCSRMFNVGNIVSDYDNATPVLNLIPSLELKMNSDTSECTQTGEVEKGSHTIECNIKDKYLVDTDRYETLYLDNKSEYYKELLGNIKVTQTSLNDNTTDDNPNLQVEKECTYAKNKLKIKLQYTITAPVESHQSNSSQIFVPFLSNSIMSSLGLQYYNSYIIPTHYVVFDDDYSGGGKGAWIGMFEFKGNEQYKRPSRSWRYNENESHSLAYTEDAIFAKYINEESSDLLMFAALFQNGKQNNRGSGDGCYIMDNDAVTFNDFLNHHQYLVIYYRTCDKTTEGGIKYIPGDRMLYNNTTEFYKHFTKALAPLLHKFVYYKDKSNVTDVVSYVKYNSNIQIPVNISTSTSSKTSDNEVLCIQSYKLSQYVEELIKINELSAYLNKNISCVNPKVNINTVDTYVSFNKTFSNNNSVKMQMKQGIIPSVIVKGPGGDTYLDTATDVDVDKYTSIYSTINNGTGSTLTIDTTKIASSTDSTKIKEFRIGQDTFYSDYNKTDISSKNIFGGNVDYYSSLCTSSNNIDWDGYKPIFAADILARETVGDGRDSHSNRSRYYMHTNNKSY